MMLARLLLVAALPLSLAACMSCTVDSVGLKLTLKESPSSELELHYPCEPARLNCSSKADPKPTYYWAATPTSATPQGPL